MRKIEIEISKDDPSVSYIYFPNHPGKGKPGVVKKQLRLYTMIEGYSGPDVYLDFGENDNLIGIEVLLDDE